MLTRACMLGAMLSATLSFHSYAQDSKPDGDAPVAAESGAPADDAAPKPAKKTSGKPGEKPAAPAAPQNVLPPITGGDKLTMVSGTVMTGVQIVRSTPKFYEVQMVEGQPTIQIPRRQVKSVELDDIDPGRERLREQMFPEAKEVTIASGEKVTEQLRDKLMSPISAEKQSYKDQDFVKVLEDVKSKTGTNLSIDGSIDDKPATQRRWTVEVPPDKTLMTLLREDLVGTFKWVEVVFESDSIIVMTKDAAKARAAEKAKEAPADGDAAAAPDAAGDQGAPSADADAKTPAAAEKPAAQTPPATGNAADVLKNMRNKPKS